LASTENIDKAIEQFSTALLSPESEKDAALYLLKSYYYKAEFAVQDKEEKKKIFNEGKALGEKYIEKYPTSPEFRYWYLVNLGSWAQVYGILTAAREGVSDLMKTHSEKLNWILNIKMAAGISCWVLFTLNRPIFPFYFPGRIMMML